MSLNQEDLSLLVLQAKNGDNQAFEKLYTEFYEDVYFTCLKILTNSSDAEDITQDTFVEAYHSLRSLAQPKGFRAWINRIAANKSLNYLKRMNRIHIQDNDEMNQLIDEEDFEASTEDKVIDEDVRSAIEEIMFKLPEEQRTALYLYYYCDMTAREIAEMYGCPESTVKSRLIYARKFMKKEVKKLEDNGYKLRCIAALPFLYALFRAQKSMISVSAPKNFEAVLSAKSSAAVSAVSKNMAGGTNTAQKGKVIRLSKKAKIAIVSVAAAVVVGGGAAAVVMSGCNNSDTENSKVSESSAVSSAAEESEAESSIADEESTVSEQESSEAVSEVSEESEAPKVEMTWKFREMEPPKVDKVEYVTTKTKAGDVVTVTPSIVLDMEAAEKVIKEYPKFSSLTFADLKCEQRDYDDEQMAQKSSYDQETFDDVNGIKYIYETGIAGYDFERYEKSYTALSSCDVRFTSTQTYSQYNGPEKYSLQFKYTDITQDETYDILSRIFGEEIAEYLVYCETEDGYKSDTDNNIYASVSLDDDNNSKYIFERNLSIFTGGEEFITFSVELVDKNVTGYGYSGSGYDHFENNYTGMTLPVEISDIFDSKYGGTDLGTPDKLFDKAFSYGGSFDKYEFTHMRRLNVDTLTYSDGSIYSHIYMDCYRMAAADEDTNHLEAMNATFDIIKNADSSIDIQSIKMELPTTYHRYDQENFAVLDDMIALTKQQTIDVLGVDKSLLGEVRGEGDFRMISADEVNVRLFGQDIEVYLTLIASESTGEYSSHFEIELG